MSTPNRLVQAVAAPQHRQQVCLPEELEHKDDIAEMVVGQTGYTVPWAMWVDEERRCWLAPDCPLTPHPHGTATMQVTRDDEGWHVTVPSGARWRRKPGYYTPGNIAVITLTRRTTEG